MKRSAIVLLTALSLAAPASAGEKVAYLYRLHCSGCHGIDGEGSKRGRIPTFPGIVGHFATSREGRLYLVQVPGVANAALSDAQTAEVLNFVLQTWGNSDSATKDFTPEEVHSLRQVHVDDIAALRQKLATELAKRGVSTDY